MVIGLGILGQITVQLLKAAGCLVIGTDVDPRRIETARRNGMDHGLSPADGPVVERVAPLSNGFGADGVIITAATPSHDVISQAFRSCRRKGRVVLVGDVGLNIDRNDMYAKELDFLISTSYGPGRYDPVYEEEGQDYPAALRAMDAKTATCRNTCGCSPPARCGSTTCHARPTRSKMRPKPTRN